jgi:uncharacterized membrane protein YbhN (UPF0104 family)
MYGVPIVGTAMFIPVATVGALYLGAVFGAPLTVARSLLRRLLAIPTPVVFLLSVGIAVLLLWQQGAVTDIGPALRSANIGQMALAFALYLAGLVLLCLRWHVLVKMIGGNSDGLRASEAFVTSVAINYAAPLSLAIPSRALLTMRALGLNRTETAGLTFWEVAADLLVLALATLLWLLVGGWRGEDLGLDNGYVYLGVFLAVCAVLAIVAALVMIQRLRALAIALYGRVAPGLRYPRQRPRPAAFALGLTGVFWITQGLVLWTMLQAIDGESPPASLVLGLVSLPILIGMLSPVPGGAGIREALMIAVAGVHGAGEASVLLAGVTYRIALFAALPVLYGAIRLLLSMRGDDRGTMSDNASARDLIIPGGDSDSS